jgi:hypothetical protein
MKNNRLRTFKPDGLKLKALTKVAFSRIRLILIMGLVIGCAIVAFSVRAANRRPVTTTKAKPPALESLTGEVPNKSYTLAQSSDQPLEVEVVTVQPYGFEPKAITRPPGAFLLAVHNQSRLEQLAVQLNRTTGLRVKDIAFPRGRIRWHTPLDLPPGEYVLTETDHPEWMCNITITAQ